MHPAPLTSRGDDARPAKVGQVARDFWLADPEDLHKIANANFLVGDEIEQAKAGAIGHGAKEKIEGKRFFLARHRGEYIWLDRYEQGGLDYTHTRKRIYIVSSEELCQPKQCQHTRPTSPFT